MTPFAITLRDSRSQPHRLEFPGIERNVEAGTVSLAPVEECRMITAAAIARCRAAVLASLALLGTATAAAQAPMTAQSPMTAGPGSAAVHTAMMPEAVVAAVVAARGDRYAGDCAATQSPRDIGALCSRLVAERDGVRAYLLGRTFSEFGWWLFVGRADAGWHAVGTAPLDFLDLSGTVPWPPASMAAPSATGTPGR